MGATPVATRDRAEDAREEDRIMPMLFGVGHARVAEKTADKANTIARKHGCWFINIKDGNTYRYWFEGPNRGEPFDGQMAAAVMASIEAAGIKLP